MSAGEPVEGHYGFPMDNEWPMLDVPSGKLI